jgi:large subunit ribosomal protein L21e
MARTSKGLRAETRHKLRKDLRLKWKPEPFLRVFSKGQRVAIDPNPLSQKGMPWPKYKGLVGYIEAKQGRAYKVILKVGKKTKYIIARPEHLKAV